MKTWKSIFKSKQVRKECLYSFLILMGIRLLATIPTPGTNPDYFKTLIHDNSALTFIDAMTGNGLSGMSIMALSITPYITASIMVQLAGVIYPHIHEMEKGMEDERKRIHIITLVLGGFVALMESSMIAIRQKRIACLGKMVLDFTCYAYLDGWISCCKFSRRADS